MFSKRRTSEFSQQRVPGEEADMVDRPALVIDCAEIGKAKNDAGLISALAEQTGKARLV